MTKGPPAPQRDQYIGLNEGESGVVEMGGPGGRSEACWRAWVAGSWARIVYRMKEIACSVDWGNESWIRSLG